MWGHRWGQVTCIGLFCAVLLSPGMAFALEETQVVDLKTGQRITLPDPESPGDDYVVTVSEVGRFDAEGSKWYMVRATSKGTGADGSRAGQEVIFFDFSGTEPQVDVAIGDLTLQDLGFGKRKLAEMDEKGKGNFQYRGMPYTYVESDEGIYTRGGVVDDVVYYEFDAASGGDGVTIINWQEGGEIEALLTRSVNAEDVIIKP